MKIGDAVVVLWTDAVTCSGWTDQTAADLANVTTVGILSDKSDDAITVALCVADGEVNGTVTIPRAWIVDRYTLARTIV